MRGVGNVKEKEWVLINDHSKLLGPTANQITQYSDQALRFATFEDAQTFLEQNKDVAELLHPNARASKHPL